MPKLKLPPKRAIKLPSKKVLAAHQMSAKPLAVNGKCRYCGANIMSTDTKCPSCGAEGLAEAKPITDKPATPVNPDVIRAAKIAESLGSEGGMSSIFDGPGLFGEGCLSMCIMGPFAIVNPFFIAAIVCKLKALDAIKEGRLDDANRLKNRRILFDVLGWLFLPLELWIAYCLKFG